MRFALGTIVLLMLVANPCFAKSGHALHGTRAGTVGNAASGKGGSSAKPSPSKANVPSEEGPIIAPPVLPPHRVPQQQVRIVSPSAKRVGPGQASRDQAAATTIAMPIARNAIGQPVGPAKTIAARQSPVLVPQSSVASPPPSPARPAARVNLANATNRGSINGAAVIRPAAGPAFIGGPAQVRYGISATTVQNKH